VSEQAARFYFTDSGRDPVMDWGIAADFSNITPVAPNFFIEFTPPRSKDYPAKAGVLFVANKMSEVEFTSGHDALLARVEEMLSRATARHPQKDADAAWWQTVSDAISQHEPELALALWKTRADEVPWWLIGYPFIEVSGARNIMGPYFSWNTGVTKTGRIIEGRNGWMLSILPFTDELDSFQIKDMSSYLISTVLKPALLTLHLLNQSSTTVMQAVYPDTSFLRQLRRQHNYSPVKYHKVLAQHAIGEMQELINGESIDRRRLAELIVQEKECRGPRGVHDELIDNFPRIPIIIADNIAEDVYRGTSKENFEFKTDFAGIIPPPYTSFIEVRRPSKVVSEEMGEVTSEILPRMWGFIIEFSDTTNPHSDSQRDFLHSLNRTIGENPSVRWILSCEYVALTDLLTGTEMSAPIIEEAVVIFQIDAGGRIVGGPILFNPPTAARKIGMAQLEVIVSQMLPVLTTLCLRSCINVEFVDFTTEAHVNNVGEGAAPELQFSTVRVKEHGEVMKEIVQAGESMPASYIYYSQGRVKQHKGDMEAASDLLN
jgi:hypothetical protein